MDQIKLRLYQLKKQNLLVKEKQTNYQKILNEHIGLHSTDYLTPYVSLWSRVENFDPAVLFHDLNKKEAVRLRAMRRTIFVSHIDMLPTLIPSISSSLESHKLANIRFLVNRGMNEDLPDKISQDIIKLLEQNEMLTTSQIRKELESKYPGEYIKATLTMLEFECQITRVGQRYITDKIIKWGLLSKHYPVIATNILKTDEALQELFLKYIKLFGPICLEDFCWWLPIKKTPAKQMLDDLQDKLIELEFNGTKYYMTKEDYQEYENFNHSLVEPIINFLPYEDHFPKAYKIRNWFITEEVIAELFDEGTINMGQIRPSIWFNGEIKGRWEINWLDAKKTKLEIQLIYLHDDVKSKPKIMKLVEKERLALEQFYNEQFIPIMKCQY